MSICVYLCLSLHGSPKSEKRHLMRQELKAAIKAAAAKPKAKKPETEESCDAVVGIDPDTSAKKVEQH